MYMCRYMYMYMYGYITHYFMHTHTHKHIHTHLHTYIYIRAHIRTRIRLKIMECVESDCQSAVHIFSNMCAHILKRECVLKDMCTYFQENTSQKNMLRPIVESIGRCVHIFSDLCAHILKKIRLKRSCVLKYVCTYSQENVFSNKCAHFLKRMCCQTCVHIFWREYVFSNMCAHIFKGTCSQICVHIFSRKYGFSNICAHILKRTRLQRVCWGWLLSQSANMYTYLKKSLLKYMCNYKIYVHIFSRKDQKKNYLFFWYWISSQILNIVSLIVLKYWISSLCW